MKFKWFLVFIICQAINLNVVSSDYIDKYGVIKVSDFDVEELVASKKKTLVKVSTALRQKNKNLYVLPTFVTQANGKKEIAIFDSSRSQKSTKSWFFHVPALLYFENPTISVIDWLQNSIKLIPSDNKDQLTFKLIALDEESYKSEFINQIKKHGGDEGVRYFGWFLKDAENNFKERKLDLYPPNFRNYIDGKKGERHCFLDFFKKNSLDISKYNPFHKDMDRGKFWHFYCGIDRNLNSAGIASFLKNQGLKQDCSDFGLIVQPTFIENHCLYPFLESSLSETAKSELEAEFKPSPLEIMRLLEPNLGLINKYETFS